MDRCRRKKSGVEIPNIIYLKMPSRAVHVSIVNNAADVELGLECPAKILGLPSCVCISKQQHTGCSQSTIRDINVSINPAEQSWAAQCGFQHSVFAFNKKLV